MADVLVVDDDPGVRDFVRTVLEMWDLEVLCACSGYEAIVLLSQHGGVSLVVTDMEMPGMNGRALAQRAQRISPGLQVVGMSETAMTAVDLGPGFAMLLRKPVGMAELSDVVELVPSGSPV